MLLLFNRIVIYDQYIGFIEFNPKITFEDCSNIIENINNVSFSEVKYLEDFGKLIDNEFNGTASGIRKNKHSNTSKRKSISKLSFKRKRKFRTRRLKKYLMLS